MWSNILMRPNTIFILLCLTCGITSQGIGQEVQTYVKFDDGKLWIRWNPTKAETWEKGLQQGYYIEKYEENQLLFKSELIKPQPFKDIETTDDGSEVNEYLHTSLIHFDELDPKLIEEEFPSDVYSAKDVLNLRYSLSNYLQNNDFAFSLYAGLAYEDNDIKGAVNYSYLIYSAANLFEPVRVDFNTSKYSKPELPELRAKWNNRRAYLKWNTRDYRNEFFGWKTYISVDSLNYTLTDSSVMMNVMDTSTNVIFHDFEQEVIVGENDTKYFFRLQGFDYFGGSSEYYSEVSGIPSEGIAFSPIIDKATQNPDNTCKLEWIILDKFKDKVKEYRLYAGPTWDGPYVLDTMGISPDTRSIEREIVYNATYWRIAAVDDQGKEFSSFPKLIMSIDTIPPAVPINIESSIDSNGIVKLAWEPNDEEDFIGYKVFYTHDTLHPFILDHERYIEKPSYTDTLFLNTYKKYTYYKIISVDKRNNRSNFSEVIVVRKPDKIPPVEPNFSEITNYEGQVIVKWNKSASPDVASYQIYRKQLDSSDRWRQLKEWFATDSLVPIYVDTMMTEEIEYAYILTATDEDGNVSAPSDPVVGRAIKTLKNFPINDFKVFKRSKSNWITWDFPLEGVFEIWLYRRVEGQKPRLLSKFEPPVKEYLDTRLVKDKRIGYFMTVYFDDGRSSNYSIEKEAE